jgi:U3 small nucleolar RNA-associated protein 14
LKDFEVLQKTDPEAALQQLEQLERTRAEERVSLRHRSTGQWARSKAVRAKYDKEVSVKYCIFILHGIP